MHTQAVAAWRLYAMLVHDAQTPLTTVKGYAQLLKRGNAECLDTARDYGRIIDEQTDRAIRIIQDVLLALMLEAGERAALSQPIRLRALLGEVLRQFRLDERERIDTVRSPEITMVSDLPALTRLMVNLLCGTLKYAGPADRVSVSAEAEGNTVLLRVEVEDTGVDVTIWEQATGSGSPFEERGEPVSLGSGLTFLVAALIAQSLGGELRLEDVVDNRGHAFVLVLPACTSAT
ncbi:MAG: HAMP domain-containing histidine kinase [Chloroflexi bacterium]|nr:HAMP domain-containing histidine kinase [Chloroflexota bacterium]